jgi:outer membrane receptor protein involved in Fe transport
LLLGLPSQLALTSYTVMDQGQDMQFYFIQDDYRLTQRLTLNLGIRYEFATPPRERDDQLANFDPGAARMVFSTDGGLFERSLIRPDRNNFAPRLGFSYSPIDRWVVGEPTAFFTATPCDRGVRECSGSIRLISWTICCRRV